MCSPNDNSKRKDEARTKTHFLHSDSWLLTTVLLAVSLCLGGELRAQESAGQAEVAFQGYYLSGSGQSLINTTGMAMNIKEFIPGVGLIDGSFEGYGSSGFQTGTSYLGLAGVPIKGWHWDFMGGDFHFSSNLVENPFYNIYTPEIAGRGFRIAMKRSDRTYQVFFGQETLLGGPRIPFRVSMPQKVLGASMQQKVGKRWEFGFRFLNLSTDASALTSQSNFFFVGQEFRKSNSLTFQSSYSFTKRLKFYTEASYGTVSTFTPSPVGQQPFSLLIGPTWETDKFSLRANYVRQSTTYLPMLGYFVGDRKGPYVEGHYRPWKRVDLYGSASHYSNNLESNPELSTFRSTSETAGVSLILPWKFNANASLSTVSFTVRDPSRPGEFPSNNRQFNLTLSRPVRRHNLRLSYIDMKLNTNFLPQTQRFTEIEDMYTWKRLVVGGAVRVQNSHATETRNTLFFRGSIQTTVKRISAYGYIEKGSDLVNQSIFSTSAYSSTVAGVSAPLFKGWNLQFEAFRNNLNTALNPENIFLFPNGGMGLNTALSAFNQWSVFFRIGKQFRWGKALPEGGMAAYAREHAPLVGSVQGYVLEETLTGTRPAANIPVSLDGYRTAVTDAQGRYGLFQVPEGPHQVGLDMEQLPTDYDPGAATKERVSVEPSAIARADFKVIRLTSLTGKIVAPKDAQVENVVVRLAGTNRYTTPDQDGSFGFYNLREGQYEMVIDEQTVPEGFQLASPARAPALASSANPPPPVKFELKAKPPQEKPIREILQKRIELPAVGGANGNGKGTGNGNQNGSGGASHKGSGSGTQKGSGGGSNRTGGGASRSGGSGGTTRGGAGGTTR